MSFLLSKYIALNKISNFFLCLFFHCFFLRIVLLITLLKLQYVTYPIDPFSSSCFSLMILIKQFNFVNLFFNSASMIVLVIFYFILLHTFIDNLGVANFGLRLFFLQMVKNLMSCLIFAIFVLLLSIHLAKVKLFCPYFSFKILNTFLWAYNLIKKFITRS